MLLTLIFLRLCWGADVQDLQSPAAITFNFLQPHQASFQQCVQDHYSDIVDVFEDIDSTAERILRENNRDIKRDLQALSERDTNPIAMYLLGRTLEDAVIGYAWINDASNHALPEAIKYLCDHYAEASNLLKNNLDSWALLCFKNRIMQEASPDYADIMADLVVKTDITQLEKSQFIEWLMVFYPTLQEWHKDLKTEILRILSTNITTYQVAHNNVIAARVGIIGSVVCLGVGAIWPPRDEKTGAVKWSDYGKDLLGRLIPILTAGYALRSVIGVEKIAKLSYVPIAEEACDVMAAILSCYIYITKGTQQSVNTPKKAVDLLKDTMDQSNIDVNFFGKIDSVNF